MATATLLARLVGDSASMVRAFKDGEQASKNLDKAVSTVKTGVTVAGTAAAAGLGIAIKSASDLGETLSKSNTVFKENGKEIEEWADGAARAFGQSKKQALDAASQFGNMFIQLGVGREEAVGMSKAMVELASDFASFHNVDIEQVLIAQQAAFRGEYDALQRFVPVINAALVDQKALKMGLAETTKELTMQDKALAVNALILEGAGDAAGDFARTQDSLQNQSRMVTAQLSDLASAVGTALVPVLVKLVPIVVGFLEALAKVPAPVTAVILGLVALAGALTPIVGLITTLAPLFVAGGAAIAALSAPVLIVIGVIAALIAIGVLLYKNWDTIKARAGELAGWLGDRFNDIKDTVGGAIQWLTDRLNDFLALLAKVRDAIPGLSTVAKVVGAVLNPGAAVASAMSSFGRMLGFDAGGIVPGPIGSPQLAVVHGGETILPTHRGGGGMPPVIVNIYGDVNSEVDFERKVTRALNNSTLRLGGRGY